MESNREIPMVVGENGKFVIDDVLDRMDYINTQIAADFSVFSKTVLRMIGYPPSIGIHWRHRKISRGPLRI